jgi:membrane fusion protein (multidrug efflux system)
MALGAVLLNGLWLIGFDRKIEAQQAPKVPEVAIVAIQPQRIELTTELPGRTSAYRIAEIRPQVNGIIQKRLFQEGSDVKAGQLLY